MKIIDVRWFCGRTNVGIVRVLTEYDGIRYYICGCSGLDEIADQEEIAAWGSSFDSHAGDVLFGVDAVSNGDAVQIPRNKEHATAMAKMGLHYLGVEL